MSQYLGRGAVSRGRMTISRNLNTVVSDVPYLKDENDIEAVITGIENLQKALEGVEGLVWEQPAEGVSAREYVENVSLGLSFPAFPFQLGVFFFFGTRLTGCVDGCRDFQPPRQPLDR